MKAIVGYTGFVGSNICAAEKFDGMYNSKNIQEAYDTRPDLLIYAGLRAEKYLANYAPEKDMGLIWQAEENINKINPKRLVLISTIDVFSVPKNVDENSVVEMENIHPYGYNRYQLELWVRERYSDALIVRLPGLFGKNIKKNFIYDYMNRIPFMLTEHKFMELTRMEPVLKEYYQMQENGFYKANVSETSKELLKKIFCQLGFTSLNFTDSRSVYQFYNLGRLWSDIKIALHADLTLWHAATEPISAGELYEYLTGDKFKNELNSIPADYDYRTIHSDIFGGIDGKYICKKEQILKEIKRFIETESGGH